MVSFNHKIFPNAFWPVHIIFSKRAAVFCLQSSGFLFATLPCTSLLLSVLLMMDSLTLAKVQEVFSCFEVTLSSPHLWSDLCWLLPFLGVVNDIEFPQTVCGLVESKLSPNNSSEVLKPLLFMPWYTDINMCWEEQTWIDSCFYYYFLTKIGHPHTSHHHIDWKY